MRPRLSTMVKRRRKFVLVGVALIALVLPVTIVLLSRDSYRPLETIATKTSLPGDVSWCEWGSEDEILVQRENEPAVKKRNIKSGTWQNLDAVTRVLSSLKYNRVLSMSPIDISP